MPFFIVTEKVDYTRTMNTSFNINCEKECLQPKRPCGCPPDSIVLPKVERTCTCPRRCDPCDEPVVFFRTQTIPASMGDSTTGAYKPANGMYKNMLVRYEADGSVWIYDSAGVYTNLKEAQESES